MANSGSVPADFGEGLPSQFLEAAHRASPMDIPALVDRYAASFGMKRAGIHLVDLQQNLLHPLAEGPPLPVDGSLAGSCYRTQRLRVGEDGDELSLWLPLVDGSERLGVLGVHGVMIDAPTLRRCRVLAHLLAVVITSKRAYSDTYARKTRTQPMRLSAELVRAFLPPRTLGTDQVISTAVLEPAYSLGGDAFDHSLINGSLHTTIVDAMGHDVASGLVSSLALAGSRSSRRDNAELADLVTGVDDALARWFPERFCTGIFAQLELANGRLRWANCGHPPPMLVRDQRLLPDALERSPEPPLGVLAGLGEHERTIHEITLHPGDRVLFYTDGVIEARAPDGGLFGLERFADFIIRATAAGEPAPEALRRLIHDILHHQEGQLHDDATIMMFEWCPQEPEPYP
ncbi:PP2C family protein-serine/threonine phosphatase [Streptomyces gobiensis]|uniref:PP2C family protein-serine/threonine phosphatase n=1 Tax=Streptomyces gobiensis TaxID=2875706 RepID=UPI001E51EEFB|nr:PP2C family protein-serine/threonine phosphatase [Streptomyces gobiensis]UGY92887.1 serine/threonine-protein phosphatase [Streptomyces gobiensis]